MEGSKLADRNAQRVLITRLSHIGDCVFTMPLASALRKHMPAATIVWATESPSDKLLRDHKMIDDLVVIPRGWLKSRRNWIELRRQLRDYRFDVAIDPQGLTKSALLGWLSGARQRIGLTRPWSGELAPWTYTRRVQPRNPHIVPRTLGLLEPLGIDCYSEAPHLPISAEAVASIDAFIASAHLGCGFAVINPGASWPSKCWVVERFGQVAKRLGEQHGLTSVVVWAGESEHGDAERITRSSGGHALIAPPTSLPELAAICSKARLMISADTGPLHIAAATGTACVGLYGPTRPQHCGAWGPHCRNLQAWYQSGSRKARRRGENVAMRDITVEQVCQACHELLALDAPPQSDAA